MTTNNLDSFAFIIEPFKTQLSDIVNNQIIPIIIEDDLKEDTKFNIDILKKLHAKISIFDGIGNTTSIQLSEQYKNFIVKKSTLLALENINQKTDKKEINDLNVFDTIDASNIYKLLSINDIWKTETQEGINDKEFKLVGGNLKELTNIGRHNKEYLEKYVEGLEHSRKIKQIESIDELLIKEEPKSMIELILYSTLYINDEAGELPTLIKILKSVKSAFNLLYNFQFGRTIGKLEDRYEQLRNYFAIVGKKYSIMKDDAYIPTNTTLNISDLPIQPDKNWICFYIHDIEEQENKLTARDLKFLNILFKNESVDKNSINDTLTNVDMEGVIDLLKTGKTNFHIFLLELHEQIKNVMNKVNDEEGKEEEEMDEGEKLINSEILLNRLSLLLVGKDSNIEKAVDIGNQILEKANFSNDEIDSIVSELKKKADTIYKKN